MKEIKFGIRNLPIHFGLKAIKEFAKHSGTPFKDIVNPMDSLGNLDFIVTLAVMGLNEGARRNGKDDRFVEDDIWDMFDEQPQLIFTITEAFLDAVVPFTDKLGDIPKNANSPTGMKKK